MHRSSFRSQSIERIKSATKMHNHTQIHKYAATRQTLLLWIPLHKHDGSRFQFENKRQNQLFRIQPGKYCFFNCKITHQAWIWVRLTHSSVFSFIFVFRLTFVHSKQPDGILFSQLLPAISPPPLATHSCCRVFAQFYRLFIIFTGCYGLLLNP